MAAPLASGAVKGRETVVALVTVAVPRVGALGAEITSIEKDDVVALA